MTCTEMDKIDDHVVAMGQLDVGFMGINERQMAVIAVTVLDYKLESRGLESRWCHWNFSIR